MRVLLIESDSITRDSVEMMLKSEGFNVFATDGAEDVVSLGRLYDYDMILIDEHRFVRELRNAGVATPILIVSGFAGVDDKVRVLDAGADDYMTKPFHKEELVSRMRAIVRRSKGQPSNTIRIGDLVVDISNKVASAHGNRLRLTHKEYQMLELLALRRGSTVTKEQFLDHIYGGRDEPELKIIDVFVCKARKKLRAANVDYLETVWGRGYVLRGPKVESPSLAPELSDMVDEPPTGYVSETTVGQRREEDRRKGLIKSPSIVPEQGAA